MHNFLPALFAFFFWGKTTADHEDRTRHSSWMRTFTFAVLTLSVGLIYMKTLDVPMMSNYVDIRADRYTVRNDTLGERVNLLFNNVLADEDLSCKVDSGLVQSLGFKPNDYDFRMKFSGIGYNFHTTNDSTYKVIDRGVFAVPVRTKPYNINSANCFYKTYNNDSLHNLLNNFDIRYVIVSKLQPIIEATPFQTYPHWRSRTSHINDTCGFVSVSHWYPKSKTLPGWMNMKVDSLMKGVCSIEFEGLCIDREKSEDETSIVSLTSYKSYNFANHLNYFTAADISQSNYQLLVHSDCPIDTIKVAFNTPTEMPHLPFKVDEMSPYGFTITSQDLIDKIQDRDIRFFVKFPAMANKQLVRSLILTTLLTALASLFLTNLYFCFRRLIHRLITRQKQDEQKVSKRLKRAKFCHNVMVIFYLTSVLLYALSVYNGWMIPYQRSYNIWFHIIRFIYFLAFPAIEYGLFRYARLDKSDE